MNIKVLQYIDNTPKNNITTGQAAVTGDNIPSNSSSAVNSTGADFDQVLDDAKMAEAAVAIDRLIAQSNGGSVDMSLVQRFFDQISSFAVIQFLLLPQLIIQLLIPVLQPASAQIQIHIMQQLPEPQELAAAP